MHTTHERTTSEKTDYKIGLISPTTSVASFAGPVSKALSNVCSPSVMNFKRFDGVKELVKLPDDVYKKLSNDQKYLCRIVNALITKRFPESLKQMKIGNLNHSRWITTASRICKLYALTAEPSDTLKIFLLRCLHLHSCIFSNKKNMN